MARGLVTLAVAMVDTPSASSAAIASAMVIEPHSVAIPQSITSYYGRASWEDVVLMLNVLRFVRAREEARGGSPAHS